METHKLHEELLGKRLKCWWWVAGATGVPLLGAFRFSSRRCWRRDILMGCT